jgi:PIN domain nuclease of toxin-antitoxin system
VIAFLDTHAFFTFGEGRMERFGAESRRLLAKADLVVSPVVLFELHFLHESRRIGVDPNRFYADVLEEGEVRESTDPLATVVRAATPLAWTRDPFDRLIVATAILHRARLVTKDADIHEHFDGAVW